MEGAFFFYFTSWFISKDSLAASLALLSSCQPPPFPFLCNFRPQMMDVWTPGQSSIKTNKQTNWHTFHIETPILRGVGGEGHQLSFCVWHMSRVTFTWAEVRGGYNRLSVHWSSLSFYRVPEQAFRLWTRSTGGHLGRAAAGARCALGAADAVGCAAVFRGWWWGGDLLPSSCLPCVGIDVPQSPCQERSNHKCCKRNAHHS